jgi:hypothetical protein
MNAGRFATAFGVLATGILFSMTGGSYPVIGTYAALIYALGMIAIVWAPDTSQTKMED